MSRATDGRHNENGGSGEQRPVTIYHIARELGISAGTVSRALNHSNLVTPDTRERVSRTAEEMGYLKRRIRRHRGRAILNVALFLPFGGENYLHLFYDPAEFIHALRTGFGEVRANVITLTDTSGASIFEHKKHGQIDACVFGFTTPTPELLAAIDDRRVPVVLINRIDSHHNYVASDHAAGMERLLAHVLEVDPHPRPCFLGLPAIPQVSELRRDGLLRAAASRGVRFSTDDTWDLGSLGEITPRFIERLLATGYDTVMCFNDVVAVYIYQCALSMGLQIPEAFSLTGFDNSPVRSLVSQPITTVDLTVAELGRRAGTWLRERIIERSDEPLQLQVPGAVVAGATVAPRPNRAHATGSGTG